MPLRAELERQPETIQEFELAASARFYDGLELMIAGRSGPGIYLMGYAAEMLLKGAYFLFTGARPADRVRPRLAPARRVARILLRNVEDESFHSVRFWALLLLTSRRRAGRLLGDGIEAQFQQRTRRLYQNWWVEMRYRSDRSRSLQMRSVYDDVNWLRENYAHLWR